jgi:hypothetical protein
MDLLAPGQGDLQLDPAVLEIHAHRNHGQALLLHLGPQMPDLGRVQQQLARPLRLVPGIARVLVFRDVHAHKPGLAVRNRT